MVKDQFSRLVNTVTADVLATPAAGVSVLT